MEMNLGYSPHNLNPTHAPEKFDNFGIFSLANSEDDVQKRKKQQGKIQCPDMRTHGLVYVRKTTTAMSEYSLVDQRVVQQTVQLRVVILILRSV